ncbi:MAG TPA: hypothetical protein PK096_03610 [Candidatus Saccharibacteria bacterium]|nr:hypothetical protein [Candidatus Saccharibacteria bacterium]HRK94430.1 hypothetical protein [Candidatus Saccharibacteria bacterium]
MTQPTSSENIPQTNPEPGEDHSEAGLHPLLGSMIGRETSEVVPEPLDSLESLRELEKATHVASFIQKWYSPYDQTSLESALGPLNSHRHIVERINNQFLVKIAPALTTVDRDEALDQFRAVIPNTIDEEMVVLINDEQFDELHAGLHEYLETVDEEIEESIQANLVEIARADRMEFSGRVTRSLENMRENGMVISIDPANAEEILRAHQQAGDGILPVTEYVKNGKILGVNGFLGSKVSLAVHDFMDHLWGFDMIEKAGILDRYADMFDSIGSPQSTDIYKREGEIVASVAFGVRYFHTLPSAFGPLMRSSQIEAHLDDLFVDGDLEERHMEAYRTLKGMRKGSMDWQSLGFSFSNYLTELDEQRRKFGRIKQVDPKSKRLVGELDPFSPDFVCFFIDTHQQLMSSKNKHRDDLFRFHILLEEYLTAFATGQIPQDQPFVVKPDELRDIDFSVTTLPHQRLRWMRNNLGFTATRDAIV